jgi:calreticulin
MDNFLATAGADSGNQQIQRRVQTMDNAAWYQITSRFKQSFDTSSKNFILQSMIRFENGCECSGGDIKLRKSSIAPLKFRTATLYNVMFGPKICKLTHYKVQFMIVLEETDHDNHHYVDSFYDELTHSYTLIIFANRKYEVRLDGKTIGGDLNTDVEFGGTDVIPGIWSLEIETENGVLKLRMPT